MFSGYKILDKVFIPTFTTKINVSKQQNKTEKQVTKEQQINVSKQQRKEKLCMNQPLSSCRNNWCSLGFLNYVGIHVCICRYMFS